MVKKLEKQLAASAARTTTGNGSVEVDVSEYEKGAFYLDVTAASGTSPTLDVDIECYDPGQAGWITMTSFTQATASTSERITVANNMGSRIRAAWTIGGTSPSFTFSVGAVVEG